MNEDWVIFPIDGYGSHEIIRSILHNEKPDALWFMTDPRFYGWLWEIENEIAFRLSAGMSITVPSKENFRLSRS